MQQISINQEVGVWTQARGIPNGIYTGTWTGYRISWKIGSNEYWTESKMGVRGIVKVIVTIQDGEIRVKEAVA